MKQTDNISWIDEIKNLFLPEEWEVCCLASIPSVFTRDMLAWCFNDKLNIRTIEKSLEKLQKLAIVSKQGKTGLLTMHDRFREILKEDQGRIFVQNCRLLICFYNNHMAISSPFEKQFFYDKLYCLLLLNDDFEWRTCYQYAVDFGNVDEREKLLGILKKIDKNESLELWHMYYFIQEQIYSKERFSETVINSLILAVKNEMLDPELKTYLLTELGVLYIEEKRCEDALLVLDEASQLAQNIYEIVAIKYNKGVAYLENQQYTRALQELIDIENTLGDIYSIENSSILQAVINTRMYNLDTAIAQFKNILRIKKIYQNQIRQQLPLYIKSKPPHPLYIPINKDIYNYLGEIYMIKGNWDLSIKYHMKGLKNKENYNDIWGQAWANSDLGKVYYLMGDVEKARKHLEISCSLFIDSKNEKAKAHPLLDLSYIYQYIGEVDEAINILKKSIYLFKQEEKINYVLSGLNNLGRLYQSQGFLHLSNIIFDFCINNLDYTKFVKIILGWIYNNLGRNYLYLSDYKNALEYLNRAKNIFQEVHERRGYIYVKNNIAEVYVKLKKYDDAMILFVNSCKEKEEMGDKHAICYTYRELAELFLKLDQKKEAYEYIQKAYELCNQYNFIMLKGDILMSKGNYFAAEGQYEKALNEYMNALNNYEYQNFYSRHIHCKKTINRLIENTSIIKDNYTDNVAELQYRLNSAETDMIQQIQELLKYFSRKL